MDDATQEGAPTLSVEDRIEGILGGDTEAVEETKPVPKQATEEVAENADAETDDKSETVEAKTKDESVAENDTTEEVSYDADEIASLFGLDEGVLDVDEDGNATFKTKVNGEESSVNLKDLIRGHQLEQNVNQKSMELSERLKASEQLSIQNAQAFDAQLQNANMLTKQVESQLLQEYEYVDWNALRVNDPAEYAAKQQDYTAKAQQIHGMRDNLVQQQQQFQHQQQEAQHQQLVRNVAAQQEVLLEVLPEWKDNEVAQREASEITAYLVNERGLTPEEASKVYDHKHVMIARDAMLYRKMMGKTAPESKKVVRKIKAQKSIATKSKAKADLTGQARRKASFKKSGSTEALASLLVDRM